MIELEKEDGLWRVTLNRPEKANALTREMLVGLAEIAEAAQEAKALVLTGAGRVFCAGMDLDAAKAGLASDPVWERLSGALAALPGLSLCALNGTLAGGAFGMALACDLRIAVPNATFFYPVMKLGFLPQPSDPGRLVALVGPARAKLILMGGAKIGAEEALAIGLIERVVPQDALEAEVAALCADVRTASHAHVGAIKRMTRAGTRP